MDYFIEDVEVPIGYPVFPIKNAQYIESYNENGKTSLIFVYKVKKDEFYDWGRCWIHIARNFTRDNSDKDYDIIETHIYQDKIKKISKTYPDDSRKCGGGTVSFS
jgi:hypothetical protein